MHEFTEEHELVRKMVRRWTTERLEPKVDALEAGEPPYQLMRELARVFGIAEMAKAAIDKPDREGGRMRDPTLAAILSIELSRVSPGFTLAFGASAGLAGGAIMARGTPEQKRRWGLPLLTFEKIGAWGMTEPGAGSDAFRSMRTVAVPRGDGYLLNGQKTFITNAPYADIMVVYAKIDRGDGVALADRPIQPFVVERGDPGVETSRPMRKMGMHASPTGEIFLQDCALPADRLLGGREQEAVGRDSGRDVFHSERTGMAPMCVGIIERCLDVALAYARERVTWGKRIADYQLVQDKLARMYMHLENCKNLMFKQLTLTGEGRSMTPAQASATKLYCARAATECALDAVQILGGNGYMQEYRVEMLARDAKLLQIGGGTDEIQIINIARHLIGG
jgi:hypothetical protein